MKYRSLGNASVDIGEIGLGTEYLSRQSPETIKKTVEFAISADINLFDLVFTFPSFLQAFSEAIEPHHDQVNLTVHIGAGIRNGKYQKIRSLKGAQRAFYEVLTQLNVDQVDLIAIQNVNSKEYPQIMKQTGLIRFAEELKETGQAKYLGISIHNSILAQQAISTGKFDFIMSQFNLFAELNPNRRALIQRCEESQIGFIAIKPYGGGHLLQAGRKKRVSSYKTGGEPQIIKLPKMDSLPTRCLAYILEHAAITSVIPGAKNIAELQQALDYHGATSQQKDYKPILESIVV
ncbi:MAG: aldo/keto reductase [Candidatus Thorarchaeota archaeon]